MAKSRKSALRVQSQYSGPGLANGRLPRCQSMLRDLPCLLSPCNVRSSYRVIERGFCCDCQPKKQLFGFRRNSCCMQIAYLEWLIDACSHGTC
jgi:hypothetical protein